MKTTALPGRVLRRRVVLSSARARRGLSSRLEVLAAIAVREPMPRSSSASPPRRAPAWKFRLYSRTPRRRRLHAIVRSRQRRPSATPRRRRGAGTRRRSRRRRSARARRWRRAPCAAAAATGAVHHRADAEERVGRARRPVRIASHSGESSVTSIAAQPSSGELDAARHRRRRRPPWRAGSRARPRTVQPFYRVASIFRAAPPPARAPPPPAPRVAPARGSRASLSMNDASAAASSARGDARE